MLPCQTHGSGGLETPTDMAELVVRVGFEPTSPTLEASDLTNLSTARLNSPVSPERHPFAHQTLGEVFHSA